jgi:hypothetical protein
LPARAGRADRAARELKPVEIANDYVWVFAGGTPPNEFLQKLSVQVGQQDLTREGTAEAKLARRTA